MRDRLPKDPERMEWCRNVERVLLKPESGHPGFQAYVLIGAAADVRDVLRDLLEAVDRLESGPADYGVRYHAIGLGDATARWEYVNLGVRIDPNLEKHRRRTRAFWAFYDSNAAGLVAFVVALLAIIGLARVVEWLH